MSATASAPGPPDRGTGWSGGLRFQLAITIAALSAVAVVGSFLALYSSTTSGIRSQIDAQLHTQGAEWRQFAARTPVATSAELERAARRFISSQLYHAESLIIAVRVPGGGTVANDPELIRREEARETDTRESGGLFATGPGIQTATVAEAGEMRVLTIPIRSAGRLLGTLRVANPLAPLRRAQSSLRRAFVLVGIVALLLALAAGAGIATLITRPLRRIARVAAAVDAGELSLRVGAVPGGPLSGRRELQVLGHAFDRMLDRLERAFRRQRDFVSDASHELRTPLTVLRAQVELLDEGLDPSTWRESRQLLLRRLDELDRLVADMLTLASAEAGQLVEPRPIDLDDFFEDLRRDLPLFGERDYRVEAVSGTLRADPDRLTQVLRNLVRNAVTHTEAGGRISVLARPRGDRLEIAIIDDGPGIPPEQLDSVFERFRRLDAARSRDRGGSGLGLAIVRAIVEAHGGHVWAESGRGRGAAFHCELPGYETARSGVVGVGRRAGS